MSTITINRKLEVIGADKVLVPGCEPSSALTSPTLMAYQLRDGICKSAIVDLDTALAAIPGSFVEFGSNFGAPRKRWFVLPPFDPETCPCIGEPDWYQTLRDLASQEVPPEEKFDYCNIIGMGFCPSPDFKDAEPPPPDPYVAEGRSSLLNRFTP